MYHGLHKYIKKNMFLTLIIKRKFLEQQISILEWFLKDHVTLKTEVMAANFSFAITGINYILKYINIKRLFVIVIIFHNAVFAVLWLVKCSLGEHKRFLLKI